MDPNPLPTRITDELWWFSQQLLTLVPGTLFGGIYAPKAGYHNTRAALLANPAWRNDYSIRLPADKRGPDDKSAAVDWTFPEAQGGDYRRISLYGGRVRDAFNARDPRLAGWREVLIQADLDSPPEGYDFMSWSTRTPDNTHQWHGHFSVLREHVRNLSVMRGMLGVLGWKEQTVNVYETPTGFFISNGIHRRGPIRTKSPYFQQATNGMARVVLTDADRIAGQYATWEDYLDAVAGPPHSSSAAAAHTHSVGPSQPT